MAARGHFIRTADLSAEIGLSRTTIWRLVKAGQLAKPAKLTNRCVGWWSEDIDAWKSARRAETQQT